MNSNALMIVILKQTMITGSPLHNVYNSHNALFYFKPPSLVSVEKDQDVVTISDQFPCRDEQIRSPGYINYTLILSLARILNNITHERNG